MPNHCQFLLVFFPFALVLVSLINDLFLTALFIDIVFILLFSREDKETCFDKKEDKRKKMKELKRTEDEVDQILEELKPLEEELHKVFLCYAKNSVFALKL